VYFYGRFDVSGQVGRDAGRQLTDFVSYLSCICHGLVGGCFVANSNTNALYRHSRAGGNPDRRITTLSYQCLKTQTLDSRLRGNDDIGDFLF